MTNKMRNLAIETLKKIYRQTDEKDMNKKKMIPKILINS